MGRNKNKNNDGRPPLHFIHGRNINKQDRELFLYKPRSIKCLQTRAEQLFDFRPLDHISIRDTLNDCCSTIEHQFIALRDLIQLQPADFERRYEFTQRLLTCLYNHHNVVYQGILFGSTVNGLGFADSDVDLRLRPMAEIDDQGTYEPIVLDDDMIERILRDIAYQTTKCSPCLGVYVPSRRCPIAKLIFVRPESLKTGQPQDSLKYDISLSTSNPLSSFNSLVLRFLCNLEPRFHLLATAIRYWSTSHKLIVPGHLSSYALVNMLIFFCQSIDPPLLPTMDQMRDLYFENCSEKVKHGEQCKRSLTRIEWQCIVCLKKECYKPSSNTEPLGVLLLKFFEFYLNFPYSTHIITTRPGRAIEFKEFLYSQQYDKKFKIKPFINIQDPFDLKHNLTGGMQGEFFKYFIVVLRYSYEKLFQELLNNFRCRTFRLPSRENDKKARQQTSKQSSRNWGLNVLFTGLTPKEESEAT